MVPVVKYISLALYRASSTSFIDVLSDRCDTVNAKKVALLSVILVCILYVIVMYCLISY